MKHKLIRTFLPCLVTGSLLAGTVLPVMAEPADDGRATDALTADELILDEGTPEAETPEAEMVTIEEPDEAAADSLYTMAVSEASEYGLMEADLPVFENEAAEALNTATDLPAAYLSADLRALFPENDHAFVIADTPCITTVKDQDSFGLCYVFAPIAAMEASAAKKYGVDPSTLDFSELHTAFHHQFREASTNPAGCEGDVVSYGNKDDYSAKGTWGIGGNDIFVTTSVSRGIGICDEAVAPFSDLLSSSLSAALKNGSLAGADRSYVLENMTYVPGADTDAVKALVQTYGSAVAWLYWDAQNYNKTYDALYTSPSATGWKNSASRGTVTNHEGLIVGWDDDFKAEWFEKNGVMPTSDGAFLVKNSWGTGNNREGYYWLSYEDAAFSYKTAQKVTRVYAYEVMEAPDENGVLHQYDGGITNAYLTTVTDTLGRSVMANTFTAGSMPEEINQVSFWTGADRETAVIDVYKNVPAGSPIGSCVTAARTTVSLPTAGYHTVELAEAVMVTPGERFSICVTLQGNGTIAPITFESKSSQIDSAISAEKGQSWYKNGSSWVDSGVGTTKWTPKNIRIKAHGEVVPLTRLGGSDRYATGVMAAKEAYPEGPEEVIIVTGKNFPDALAASALASVRKAPILLSNLTKLNDQVRQLLFSKWGDELRRVTIVGGGFGDRFYNELEDVTGMRSDRRLHRAADPAATGIVTIGGGDRYETAELVLESVLADPDYKGHEVVVATGKVPADALSMSPWCYDRQMPILLARQGILRDSSYRYIGQFDKVYIAGGASVVNDPRLEALKAQNGDRVTRLEGPDRYATSAVIARYFTDSVNPGHAVAFAMGADANFPDALVGGPVLGARQSAMLLVSKTASKFLMADQYLRDIYRGRTDILEDIYVMGGDILITDARVGELLQALY
ncbi:MAG: cell wall-binding repeat-containing protein [Lachnospiraceae bacterium]|nr:cell wall-binding repeat-containing protein [Lachnospiraceae bacterium]